MTAKPALAQGVLLSEAVVRWLLEADNPPMRYLTLRNLLGRAESDTEVVAARNALMESGPVARILSRQNADGGFASQSMIKEFGEERARSGYQPKHKNTIWQAIFLAQLGADGRDERVRRLGNFILDANYVPDYRVFGIYVRHKRGLDFMAPPCFVANMVWALSKFGFAGDRRIQDSIRWLVKYQRFDDGDFTTPKEWPYRGPGDRCFGAHTCFIGCTQALKAMTAIPGSGMTPDTEEFVKRAVDFVLLHRVYKRSHSADRPIKKEYLSLSFPITYYDDVPGILDSLKALGVQAPAIDEAVRFVLSKRLENGRWALERTVSSSSTHVGFGCVGEENKWVTHRALRCCAIESAK